MNCTHPLKGFVIGKTKNDRDSYLVTDYSCDHVELINHEWKRAYSSFITPRAEKVVKSYSDIPCGQCIACRINHARDIAIRCALEMREHEDNCFITLSYDDNHIPHSYIDDIDDITGEVKRVREGDYYSLDKNDLQKFWKRLRKATGKKIRYVACSEYGDDSLRPHYHAIIFGWKPDDLKFYKKTSNGDILYTSKFLESVWSDNNKIPIGFCPVGEATYESAGYVARYVVKKAKGKTANFYDLHGLEEEKIFFSNKPGIAKNYYEKNKDKLFELEKTFISNGDKVISFKPFRYYKKLYEVDDPVGSVLYKVKNQKFIKDFKKFKTLNTTKTYLEVLADENKMNQQNSKKRRNNV